MAALSQLYATVRLFVNFFQPSFKLADKTRDGARVRKRYHAPATPCQRLLADPGTSQGVRDEVNALFATLDPILLLRDMRRMQQRLVDLADKRGTAPEDVPPIEEFLAGLRVAWKDGEVRPTAKPAAKPKRGRRWPDPLVDVTDRLREWFKAEPWRTSRQLLERLQAEYPGRYPDGLLRTLQRRVKIWRHEMVHELVFGPYGSNSMMPEAPDGADLAPTLPIIDPGRAGELDPMPGAATTTAVDNRLAAARLLAVAATSRLPTAPETPRTPSEPGDASVGEH